MSMLSSQADELRGRAKVLRQGDWSDGADDAALMEQAADTIESLRDKLQGVMGTRYCELFGTPERAAQTIADVISRCDANQYAYCDDCHLFDVCEDGCNALEWLRGDA